MTNSKKRSANDAEVSMPFRILEMTSPCELAWPEHNCDDVMGSQDLVAQLTDGEVPAGYDTQVYNPGFELACSLNTYTNGTCVETLSDLPRGSIENIVDNPLFRLRRATQRKCKDSGADEMLCDSVADFYDVVIDAYHGLEKTERDLIISDSLKLADGLCKKGYVESSKYLTSLVCELMDFELEATFAKRSVIRLSRYDR